MRAALGALVLCSGSAGALWLAFHSRGRHRSLALSGVSTKFDWDLLNNSSSALLAEGPKLRSDAWFENLVTIPNSCILKRVGSHMAATALWASAVVCADYAAPWTLPVVNPTPLQVLGTAISLLLAFRTSQSYDRYWNGRDVWSDVWFSCRGLKRNIVAWSDDRFRAPGLCLVALYPIVLVYHLRSELSEPEAMRELEVALDSFTDRLAAPHRLSVACLGRLNQSSTNLPLTILEDLTVLVRTARNEGGAFDQGEFAVSIFESHVDRLSRALCNAEKIVTTPVPPSYTRHTSRLLTLYSLALPLILVNLDPPWIALPCVLLVSWALFALEEIGKIIEVSAPCTSNFKSRLFISRIHLRSLSVPTQRTWVLTSPSKGMPFSLPTMSCQSLHLCRLPLQFRQSKRHG